VRRNQRRGAVGDVLCRDILRDLQVDGAGALFGGDAEGVAHEGRDRLGADHLARELGERPHRRHHVHDLEARLPAVADRLLAGDEHGRHGAEVRVGRAGGEVQRARAEGADAHAGAAGEAPVGRRHERGRLLVPGEHQFDAAGAAQRFQHVQVLLAGDAEDALHAFVLQRGNQQLRSLRHGHRLPFPPLPCRNAARPGRGAAAVLRRC
jgi:hypothetical protein